ncbi:hypothetical protein AX17_006923 [Amanita inopinata Kibby_2008]|nr:hypothetical protein AX17_006923 [Amanita inopinata Kibby_2008]
MSLGMLPIEKALVSGKWPPSLPSPSIGQDEWQRQATSTQLAYDVVNGDFQKIFSSSAVQSFLRMRQTVTTTDDILDKPLSQVFSLKDDNDGNSQETGAQQDADSELLQLLVCISSLHAFVQANWTGPNLSITPSTIFSASSSASSSLDDTLNAKAISELSYGGEPAYHLSKQPSFLRLAQLLLPTPNTFKYLKTGPWWFLRLMTIHQQILDEPVALPEEVSSSLSTSLDSLIQTFNITEEPELAGRLLLEQGLLDHIIGQDKAAAELFVRAAQATGLEYELTGALGKRTKFQQTELSQLVLLAESKLKFEDEKDRAVTAGTEITGAAAIQVNNSLSNNPAPAVPQSLALNDDTLLEQTQFTSSSTLSSSRLSHLSPISQPALHPLDQAILLSLCLNIKNTSPSHGLTAEQISPYISRVLSHPVNWSVHTMALLLRSRVESTRTRTVERAALQLQALIDQMPTNDSGVQERLRYFSALVMPSRWEMEKELADQLLSLGVVKSALEVYERLEMWEQVVRCWGVLERPEKGLAIVKDLLEGRKKETGAVVVEGKTTLSGERRIVVDRMREAKLLCLLGDLEPQNAQTHYTKAWDVSQQTSGRAMRSLGGLHFSCGEYREAIDCLRKAVKINPLMGRSWFILGCAYMRVEEWDGAREAFGRCVRIDEEDAESWANLAGVYLRMPASASAVKSTGEGGGEEGDQERKENPTTIPIEHKMLAYSALKQGLKFSYDNWKMWYNYMIVCVDVGELFEAARALGRVVEETSGRAGLEGASESSKEGLVDLDVLDKLVDAVTKGAVGSASALSHSPADQAQEGQSQEQRPEDAGLSRAVTSLFEGTILPRISSSPRVFRAYAKLLTSQCRWEEVLKAYMDGYRVGIAGSWGSSSNPDAGGIEKWREAVVEVEDVVDVLRNFGPRAEGEGGKGKWRMQARSVVRTFMGRTKEFEDEPEWERLVALKRE